MKNHLLFVATAIFGSTPNWNITGTVISELLPVTTPTMLVTRNISTRMSNNETGIILFPFPSPQSESLFDLANFGC